MQDQITFDNFKTDFLYAFFVAVEYAVFKELMRMGIQQCKDISVSQFG